MLAKNRIPAQFAAWIKQKRIVIATVWYIATILLLAIVGKTLYKVRTVKAGTCCMSQINCGGAGSCQYAYHCTNFPINPSTPYMCC